MSQYRPYTHKFNNTLPADTSNRISKYQDIISPHRTQNIQFRNRDRRTTHIGNSFRDLSRDRPAREELMERSRNRKSSQTLHESKESTQRLDYKSSVDTRSKYDINGHTSYYHRDVSNSNERDRRGFEDVNIRESNRKPFVDNSNYAREASKEDLKYRLPEKEIAEDKKTTPPRDSYKLHFRRLIDKEDVSQFSDKILNILDNQQQQLKIIMSEMNKVSNIVVAQQSASTSKKGTMSVDDQNSVVNAGSTKARDFISVKNEPIRVGGNWIKGSAQAESSEVSRMDNLPIRISRSRKQLFVKKPDFEEDNTSNQESSPVSKSTDNELNINEMNDNELIELRKRIDSRLSQGSEDRSHQGDTKISAGSFLKKIGHQPVAQNMSRTLNSSSKPPLSMSHRK